MMTENLSVEKLRELVKPFTKEQFEELEKNTFQSPYNTYRECNGMKFKVLSERFDEDTREAFGSEYSAAWFGENGEVLSDRYFEIQGSQDTAWSVLNQDSKSPNQNQHEHHQRI